MKKIYPFLYLAILIIIAPVLVSMAQSTPVSQINNAFRTGDVAGITRYMDNVVDVTMNNNQSTSSRTQAEMLLRDFFSKNEPKNFEAGHSGQNQQTNTFFSIGHLNTSNGRYRVYILLKPQGQNYLLQEIRIEK
jgi:hypothetical protein